MSLNRPTASAPSESPPVPSGYAWVTRAAVVIALGGLLVKGWVAARGYFLVDDFIFQARAAREPFLDNLFTEHAGHLMPGGMLVAWLTTEGAPLNHTFVVASTLAAVAVAYALCWRMVTTLVGARPAALGPYLFYCFTPLLLPATVWWAAALNALPLQMAAFAAVTAYVRHARTGSRRELVICVASVAAGLLFFEKSVLVPVVVAGVALALSPEPRLLAAVRTELAARWRLWAALAGLCTAYLVLYAVTPRASAFGAPADAAAVADLVSGSLGRAVAPSLLGGPWDWVPVGTAGGIGHAPTWAAWVVADLLLLVAVGTSLLRRRARRIWATVVVVLAADLTILSISRLFVGPQIGQELRYFADLAVPAVLALTLSVLTPVGEAPDALSRRVRASVTSSRQRLLLARSVAVGAAVTFVAGAVLSAVTYDEVWSRNPARTYVTTAKAELTSLPPHTRLLDQTVPPDVLNALTAPRNTTAWLFAPLRNGPAFGETATDGWQVGEDGTVVRHEVTGIRSRPGPAEGCGWPVGRAGGSIRLGADLFSWPWVLRIDYLAGADTPAVLRLGSARTEATFTKGLGSLIVRLDGEGDRLRVDGLDPGTGLCIDTVKIGSLRAP